MKTLYFALFFLCLLTFSKSYSQTVDDNYVKSFKATIGQSGDLSLVNDKSKVVEAIQYFDGLGRPIETIEKQRTPQGQDIIRPSVFNDYGRETRKYLPFVVQNNNGLVRPIIDIVDPLTGAYIGVAQNFYNTSSSKISVDAKPFAESVVEKSDLSRVTEQGGPGTVWQPGTGNTIKRFYELNQANEVYLLTYSATDGKVILNTDAAQMFYQANQLSANRTQDERQNNVIEYVDKLGHTILKRVQVVSGAPSTTDSNRDTNYASTYYIYDDFGNLVVVLPPEAVKKLVP